MWWLIAGYGVDQYWRCIGSLLKMRWLIAGYVVAHCWIWVAYGWRFIAGDVVANYYLIET